LQAIAALAIIGYVSFWGWNRYERYRTWKEVHKFDYLDCEETAKAHLRGMIYESAEVDRLKLKLCKENGLLPKTL